MTMDSEDVPTMHLKERKFLQILTTVAAQECHAAYQYQMTSTIPPEGDLSAIRWAEAYNNLSHAAAVVEAFLARQELSEQSAAKREVTSGD